MEPGWKTYWKSPGDGGFPQTLIWDESKNVKEITLQWPKPKEFENKGFLATKDALGEGRQTHYNWEATILHFPF